MGRKKTKKKRPEETFITNQFNRIDENDFKTVKVFKAGRKGKTINFLNLSDEE